MDSDKIYIQFKNRNSKGEFVYNYVDLLDIYINGKQVKEYIALKKAEEETQKDEIKELKKEIIKTKCLLKKLLEITVGGTQNEKNKKDISITDSDATTHDILTDC